MPKERQPRVINVTKQPGQISLDLPNYFTRYLPVWGSPHWLEGEMWRRIVKNQPVATICRDTLISNLLSLDWMIIPRDSTKRDEYKSDIEYYTKLFAKEQSYKSMMKILGY